MCTHNYNHKENNKDNLKSLHLHLWLILVIQCLNRLDK